MLARSKEVAATDSIMYSLERNWEMIEAAIAELDYDTLARQPNEHSNSIAWIFGHISRVTDMFIMHRLQEKRELWFADGWCEKFNLADNPDGLGRGADLATWTPPAKEVQIAYFEAAKGITREYVPPLSAEDLEKRVVFPPTALRQEHTLNTALGQLVLESVAHGGQIAYLRGYHRGAGWYR